ncbi:MAG: class I SAM-dependent methyltransferase [Thermoplasmata archaeon]|nr:class I SAM-dependent methyltransferase [Thermoplasmata archaeon]
MAKSKSMHDRMFIMLERWLRKFHRAYINIYEKMTLEEFEMVGIKKDDRVLHIGCGPIPNTLIVLARNIQADYTGIDRDREAVEMAKEIVKEYGLDIKIEYGDALTYPLQDYDVIVVSYGVEPADMVFERIRRDARKDARIIYRKQWDFMDRIYGRKSIPHGYEIMAEHNRRDLIKSYLLKIK